MTEALEHFFNGTCWNRERVVEAQQARAIANARQLGWEPQQRNFLTAPLDEAFVRQFEHAHQVRLPAEYRSFLVQVGDGGDGPGLYMRPLGAPFDDSTPWAKGTVHRAAGEPNELLNSPFVHTCAVDMPPQQTSAQTTAGAFYLFDHGCALWDMLVVTGADEGRIWLNRLADGQGLRPAVDDSGQRLGFARYYCRWLAGW